MFDLNNLESFFKQRVEVMPEPDIHPDELLSPEGKIHKAVQQSEDYEEVLVKDTEPPYYVIAYIHKSKSLDKKIVTRRTFTDEVWEPTGEIRGKSVTHQYTTIHTYDEELDPIEMSVVGSRFIDTTVHAE